MLTIHLALSIPLEHIFKVSFMSARPKVHFKDDEDGSALDVSVDNFLPCVRSFTSQPSNFLIWAPGYYCKSCQVHVPVTQRRACN